MYMCIPRTITSITCMCRGIYYCPVICFVCFCVYVFFIDVLAQKGVNDGGILVCLSEPICKHSVSEIFAFIPIYHNQWVWLLQKSLHVTSMAA